MLFCRDNKIIFERIQIILIVPSVLMSISSTTVDEEYDDSFLSSPRKKLLEFSVLSNRDESKSDPVSGLQLPHDDKS